MLYHHQKIETRFTWRPWLAQLVERMTPDLRVVRSSSKLGVEITYKKKKILG